MKSAIDIYVESRLKANKEFEQIVKDMKKAKKEGKSYIFNNENELERIKSTFRLEGIELSEEVMDLCRKIINGETTADEEIRKIKEKYVR